MSINPLFRIFTITAISFCAISSSLAAVKKKVPVSRSSTRKSKIASPSHSSRSKRSPMIAQTWRNRQAAPSAERYREIQQVLVLKGYMSSAPTGIWDAPSSEALKRFQTDQKLSPTGKINAASLIGLGLGPKHSPPPPASPSASNVPGPADSPLTQ